MFRNIIFAAVFSLLEICLIFPSGATVIGNGNIVTVNRPVSSPFGGMILEIKGELSVYQSETAKIVISIDSNLEQFVQTEIKDGILRIKSKGPEGLRPVKCTVDVCTRNINSLTVSGSGKIHIIDKISAESLVLKISGSGEIEGEVECTDLAAEISGSGKILLTGKSQMAAFGVSGSGIYECERLEAGRVHITASGSVKALVNAIEYLQLRISGSGDIFYRGNPIITTLESGTARIKALE